MNPAFADIVFPRRLTRAFTYRIPPRLEAQLLVGQWVLAPFGRTTLPGLVLTLHDQLPDTQWKRPWHKNGLREIMDLVVNPPESELDPNLITLAHLIAEYYLAPLGLCFRLIQPPGLGPKVTRRFRLTSLGEEALKGSRRSSPSSTLLARLAKHPKGLTLESLKKIMQSPHQVLNRLKRQGWIEELYLLKTADPFSTSAIAKFPRSQTQPTRRVQHRDSTSPLLGLPLPWEPKEGHQLTSKEKPQRLPVWWKKLREALGDGRYDEFLAHSPSVLHLPYLLQAVEDTLGQNRNALIICPDIDRATVVADWARAQWRDQVATFHSSMPPTERHKVWHDLNTGGARVVVGTRSALFTPLSCLGLICVEHEEDSSYKEEQGPYYHAREVARTRAKLSSAVLLLISSHPSLETFYRFSHVGPLQKSEQESENLGASQIQVVNLQQVPYGNILSNEMIEGISRALDAGGGVVIYLNRKGFSRSLVCKDCGLAPQCGRCHVALSVHKTPRQLVCPYCGRAESIPVVCQTCMSSRLESAGFGTERIEELLTRQFPSVKVGRLDRNTVRTPAEGNILREAFHKGDVQILVGTQMLFSGRPLEPVRFVGIPYADAGLHFPDFRSAERVYHQLQDAVALARQHNQRGHVVLQTYLPTHHVIQAIAQQNPSVFYDHELALRESLGYPPFSHLIQLQVSGKNPEAVQEEAKTWTHMLAAGLAQSTQVGEKQNLPGDTILGPLPSRVQHHGGTHRQKILIKAFDFERTRTVIQQTLAQLEVKRGRTKLQFGVNVDPIEIL